MATSDIHIAAVVVLYKQDLKDCLTYQSLLSKIPASIPVLVYDNSPIAAAYDHFPVHFTYVSDVNNPGVSGAYNYASKWAHEQGKTHLLLLDSDSNFPVNAFDAYQYGSGIHSKAVLFPTMVSGQNVISPFYFRNGKTKYGNDISYGILDLGKVVGINSGSLIPLDVFDKVGGFIPELTLDWSDIFFFRKVSKLKEVQAYHIDFRVNHGLSEHAEQSLESALYRFETYLLGLRFVPESFNEKFQMTFWAFLKAMKLTLRHKKIGFLQRFFKAIV